ncbi:MAG: YfiR family protein [Chromatiales bacterium]|nr:YfiR family protein [Chromatiales bacterium]
MRLLITRLLLCTALWFSTATVAAPAIEEGSSDERLIRAVFVFNFAKFTSWPESAFDGMASPLILCTAGEDELVDTLQLLSGKRIKGRPVVIRPLQQAESPDRCHLLYVASSEKPRTQDHLESVRGLPVLTVSELPDFAETGGMIKLFHQDDRIRFMINLKAAREAGLQLSSRMLQLAIIIDQ